MRLIKFRVPHFNRDDSFSHFSYWGTIDHKGDPSLDGGCFTSPSSGLKKGWHDQFTGLHDKNGTEIYEGDITQNPTGKVGFIEFFDGAFRLFIKNKSAWFTLDQGFCNNKVIIGNIHQNPELINP